ncbi:MAG: glycosyltransferase family 2 protein [Planctomycetales bacterium]|nr:glycosyltransferase family 2 protein [Planctomycetales bacterium]
MPDLNISIAICTYNRCDMLRRVLDDLVQLETPFPGFGWELIVIDNNSDDATKSTVEAFDGRLPIRYIFEPKQGLGHARNRVLREYRADLLAFLDDDISVERQWLVRLWQASERWPDVDVFHGRVLPVWQCQPPLWLSLDPKILVRAPLPEVDRGDEEKEIGPALFTPANVAIRRCAVERAGLFATEFGTGTSGIIRGEEAYFGRKLELLGVRGRYIPEVCVHHPVDEARLNHAYFRLWSRSMGRARVRFYPMLHAGARHRWGVPTHVPREWFECRMRQFLCWLQRDAPMSFYHRCRAWKLEGMMYEGWIVQPRQAELGHLDAGQTSTAS